MNNRPLYYQTTFDHYNTKLYPYCIQIVTVPLFCVFSAELWERICRKTFPKEHRKEFESWRELYERCTTARQEKLDFLSVRVQQSYKNAHQNHRKTKLAYVDDVAKAPRDIQRAQVKKTSVFSSMTLLF